jgi:hypothetical protein
MKRFLFGLTLAAMAAIGFGSIAASASANKLQTFADNGATVTINSDGSVSIVLADASQDGGVYLNSKSQSGKPLNAVSFSFVSTGDVAGGAPRFSLPIDTDGVGGTVEGYAFLDAAGCGGVSGGTTTVSTSSSTCHVNFMGVDYANWDAFATANPTYRMAPGAIPFIIADGTAGTYIVSSIDLR